MRKPVLRSSDYVRHKPVCVATEASERLEIYDLDMIPVKNIHADQLVP